MRYDTFVKEYMRDEVVKAGGIWKLSENIGIGAPTISKVLNDSYVPEEKTFRKWFPGVEFDTVKIVVKW